jgi:tetratricopeptide (TPR) repeat protein
MNNPSMKHSGFYQKLNKWNHQYETLKGSGRFNKCLKIQKRIFNNTLNLVDYRKFNELSILRIAQLSYRLKRYEEAFSYYKKALKRFCQSTDQVIKPVVYRIYEGLHRSSAQLGLHDEVIKYGMLATHDENMNDLKKLMIYRRMMQAILSNYENHFDEYELMQGSIYFHDCLSLFEQNQMVDSYYYIECLDLTAQLYYYLKEVDFAEKYEKKANAMADSIGYKMKVHDRIQSNIIL